MKITGAVLTNGDRFQYLSQVLDFLKDDELITDIVIVDNNSSSQKEILEYIKQAENKEKKYHYIRHENNYGSAGGFYTCIKKTLEIESEFLLLLDDDAVPEKDSIKKFLEVYELCSQNGNKNIVICGNRYNIGNNSDLFYIENFISRKYDYGLVDIFKIHKIKNYIRSFFPSKKKDKLTYFPIVPILRFPYGSSFFYTGGDVFKKERPLPDKNLFLYSDDLDYSMLLKKHGFDFYISSLPKIKDVHNTFQGETFLSGLFSEKIPDFKIFLNIRNRFLVTSKYKKTKVSMLLFVTNSLSWFLLLFIYYICFSKINLFSLKRLYLISRAIFYGIKQDYYFPKWLDIPCDIKILQ